MPGRGERFIHILVEFEAAQAGIDAGPIRTLTAARKGDNVLVAWGNGPTLRFLRLDAAGAVVADESRSLPSELEGEEVFHLSFFGGCKGLAGTSAGRVWQTPDAAATSGLPAAVHPDA